MQLLVCLLVAGSSASAQAQLANSRARAPEGRVRFLTVPSERDPLEITLDQVRRQRAALGLEAADLDDWSERDRYVTHHNGVTHLVLRQRFGGIEVFNADMTVAITPEGRMLSLGHRFISGLARSVSSSSPSLSALAAVARAAEHLGLVLTQPPSLLEPHAGPAREARVLRMRFGIDERREYTLSEIGKELDLSRERIRQIEGEALARVRMRMEQTA